MLDESAGRKIFGADNFLAASGETCLASQPPIIDGRYRGGLATGGFFRARSKAVVKYLSKWLVATARCSRHCAMLHCCGEGFQLSCASFKLLASVRATSLFFSASDFTVFSKSGESRNSFILLPPQNAAPAFSVTSYSRPSRIFFISAITIPSSS